jgi:tetratricopeptide (TPR) repeat protein
MHGRTVEGREVSDDAYAAYARGAYLEARGQAEAAIQAYQGALSADGNSPAIWTRLGALYCRARPGDADDAFGEALTLDADYAPAWLERASCRQARGQLEPALGDARTAVRLDPGGSAANLLVVSLLRAEGHLREARAWLLALVLLAPEPTPHWTALRALAEASHDAPLGAYAAAELRRRAERRAPPSQDERASSAQAPSSELVTAMRAGDLVQARAVAASEHIDARRLGLLAAASGYPELAERQATLVLEADPDDPDALIAALTAAETSGATERALSLLQRASTERRPSPLGARLLGDLLRWLVGEDAARAWQEAYERSAPAPR